MADAMKAAQAAQAEAIRQLEEAIAGAIVLANAAKQDAVNRSKELAAAHSEILSAEIALAGVRGTPAAAAAEHKVAELQDSVIVYERAAADTRAAAVRAFAEVNRLEAELSTIRKAMGGSYRRRTHKKSKRLAKRRAKRSQRNHH